MDLIQKFSSFSLQAWALEQNLPVEPIVLGLCILYSFALASIYPWIPSKSITIKHLFSFLSSSFMLIFAFSFERYLHFLILALAIYYMTKSARKDRTTPLVCLVLAMGHLSYIQLIMQFWRRGDLLYPDISAPMMVFVLKVTSFAWVAHDGTKKELPDVDQKRWAVKEMPSILEYLGFAFFFPGMWAGPATEFLEYREFVHQKPPFNKIPSRFIPGLKLFILGFVLFAIHFWALQIIPYPFIVTKEFIETYPIWQKVSYIMLSAFLFRLQYHAVWKIAESCGIFAGIGYNGQDPVTKQEKFDRFENSNLLLVEFGQNVKMIMTEWNKNTGLWLRRYVYLRVTPPGRKPGGFAAMVTYFVSAFWHGFYPGYYLAFLSSTLLTMAGRSVRRYVRPLFITTGSPLVSFKSIYDVLGWFATLGAANYVFIPFVVRWVEPTLYFWKSTYFFAHVSCVVTILTLDYSGVGTLLTGYVTSLQKRAIRQSKENNKKE